MRIKAGAYFDSLMRTVRVKERTSKECKRKLKKGHFVV